MRDGVRLAVLLACVALATSRLGLLAHELVGHGGTALAVGAHVVQVRLFWFAGGWIRYVGVPSPAAALAIAMGGIAVEVAVGTALVLAVRGDALGRRILRGVGAALILHASWYLATGAFSGFGDGVLLYRELGSARVPVSIAAGLVTCAAGYAGARGVLGALAATLPRHRVAGTIAACAAAAALHGGLAAGELRLRADRTYHQTMQPERERVVAQWIEAHPQAPAPVRAAAVKKLEAEHGSFPFVWLLGAATALSVIAGARRARPGDAAPVGDRLLAGWAIAAVLAIAIVIAV
jgi:hypothetical protein